MRLVGSTQAAMQPVARPAAARPELRCHLLVRGRRTRAERYRGIPSIQRRTNALFPARSPAGCGGNFHFSFRLFGLFQKRVRKKKQTNKTHTQRREGFMVRENASVSNGAKRVVQLIPMFRVFLSFTECALLCV